MFACRTLILVAALAVVVWGTSCQEDVGNAEGCGADGRIDSIAPSQVSLLQTNVMVQASEKAVQESIPVQIVQRTARQTDQSRQPGAATSPYSVDDPTFGNSPVEAKYDDAGYPVQVAGTSKCTPTCTWKCSTAVCDEVCTPKCQAPQCQTRCNGMNTDGCKMECQEPNCAVVCPERACAAQTCNACTTNCSKPMCKLNCPDVQDCSEVCETPVCTWDCKAPEKCPKPECHMECEKPRECMDSGSGDLPPLNPGETVVRDFQTPLSLLQVDSGDKPTTPVKVLKAMSVQGSGKVDLIESIVDIEVA